MDKIQVIENLLTYILLYSYLLPVIAYCICFKKVKDNSVCNILLGYGIALFLLNVFFNSFPKDQRKIYYFLFTLFEYSSFALIFYLRILNPKIKRFILTSSILFVCFQVYWYLFEHQKVFDTIPIGIATILIFIFIVTFFLQEFKLTHNNNLFHANYIFWISLGIMLYLGLTFFFNIMADQLSGSWITKYWDWTYVFDALKNALFAYAIFVAKDHVNNKNTNTTSLPYLDMV